MAFLKRSGNFSDLIRKRLRMRGHQVPDSSSSSNGDTDVDDVGDIEMSSDVNDAPSERPSESDSVHSGEISDVEMNSDRSEASYDSHMSESYYTDRLKNIIRANQDLKKTEKIYSDDTLTVYVQRFLHATAKNWLDGKILNINIKYFI